MVGDSYTVLTTSITHDDPQGLLMMSSGLAGLSMVLIQPFHTALYMLTLIGETHPDPTLNKVNPSLIFNPSPQPKHILTTLPELHRFGHWRYEHRHTRR